MVKKKVKHRRYSRFKARFHRKDKRIPIIATTVAVAPALMAVKAAWDRSGGDIKNFALSIGEHGGFTDELIYNYTGYHAFSGQFDSGKLVGNMMMWLGGYTATAIARKMGANKGISRIPLLGKYVKI